MDINIELAYSPWFILLCLLLGGIYAGLLYYRDRTFQAYHSSVRPWLYVMTTLRFITVSIITFLLLTPLVKTVFKQSEEPLIIVAQDNSASILHGFRQDNQVDSGRLSQYQQAFDELTKTLGSNFEVKTYSFGEEVRTGVPRNYQDKQTNMGALFNTIYNQYTNQNVGAVIVASDGIYNEGQNPLYLNRLLPVPVYPVALGDTTPKKDLKIRQVYHNKIVYLGDRFPIHIDIQAQNSKGHTPTLTVQKVEADAPTKTVFTQQLRIEKGFFEQEIPVTLEAKETGIQHYRISLSKVPNEVTDANNTQSIFVEVLESKRKVLILANSPHPDLGALKRAITSRENYSATITYPDELESQLPAYNLVILHQLPSGQHRISSVLQKIEEHNIPTFYIVGARTSIDAFNNKQAMVSIQPRSNSMDEVQAGVNKAFSLFTIAKPTRSFLPQLPPLRTPFADYQLSPNTTICLHQKVGQTVTDKPLLLFRQGIEPRSGVLLGENLWRWTMYDYAQNGSQERIHGFLNKIIQYLSVKADKRRFRVTMPKNNFYENEPILFDAELYNESYELVNTPDVTIKIVNSEEKEFPFTFNKTSNAYRLNAGTFPVGNYAYEAKVTFDQQVYTAQGEFSVSPLRVEAIQTTANHQLLYTLAEQTGGQLFYPDQLAQLTQTLRERSDIKPVTYLDYRTEAFLNLKWVFFLILLLLTGEWFLRKWQGGY